MANASVCRSVRYGFPSIVALCRKRLGPCASPKRRPAHRRRRSKCALLNNLALATKRSELPVEKPALSLSRNDERFEPGSAMSYLSTKHRFEPVRYVMGNVPYLREADGWDRHGVVIAAVEVALWGTGRRYHDLFGMIPARTRRDQRWEQGDEKSLATTRLPWMAWH